MKIAMIPARMGSQRLARKNLRELRGVSLVARAVRKCRAAGCFDEIWVNSEHPDFGAVAESEGVRFHRRPERLGDAMATSEEYVAEFLDRRPCDLLFQVHSIAPLMTAEDVRAFARRMEAGDCDCLLSVEEIRIECALNGRPVNFSFEKKTNSQDLDPVQRISWSITGWRRETYLAATRQGRCATYCGRVGFHSISPLAAHVIKNETDLRIAEALFPIAFAEETS